MSDPFASHREETAFVPAQKLQGTVRGLYKAEGRGFVTTAIGELVLTFTGIPGDVHAGHTRRSGAREPWYKRGTEMANERQLSLLSAEEMRVVARRLEIPELLPEWIGGNLLLEGIPGFTLLPPRTILMFEGGATIRIDGDNEPCRVAGRSVAGQFEGREDIELAFPKQAKDMRGLVGWVEKEGTVSAGESFTARIPRQWIYRAT